MCSSDPEVRATMKSGADVTYAWLRATFVSLFVDRRFDDVSAGLVDRWVHRLWFRASVHLRYILSTVVCVHRRMFS